MISGSFRHGIITIIETDTEGSLSMKGGYAIFFCMYLSANMMSVISVFRKQKNPNYSGF